MAVEGIVSGLPQGGAPKPTMELSQELRQLFDLTQRPEHIEQLDARKYKIMGFVSLFAALTHLCFIPLFFKTGVAELAWLNLGSVALWAASFYYNRRGLHMRAVMLGELEVLVHASVATLLLGTASGFQHHLIAIACMMALATGLNSWTWSLLSVMTFGLYAALHLWAPEAPHPSFPPGALGVFSLWNIIIMALPLVLALGWTRKITLYQEERLIREATLDPLTLLPNRRHTHQVMRRLLHLARASPGYEVALCISDIDHFKAVNDTWGHDEGDRVLQEVAQVLREELRQGDFVARWGGEEFLILLPGCQAQGAQRRLEQLRRAVSGRCAVGEEARPVTMSFGLATWRRGEEGEALLKRADEALYQAKAGGRDQVALARP